MHRPNLFKIALLLLVLTACDDGGSTPNDPPVDPEPEGPVVTNLSLRLSPDVRACEVMLHGEANAVFGAAVEGRQLRRGAQLAVAFTAQENVAFDANAVTLASTDADNLQIESSTCFDAAGQPVADAVTEIVGR